MGQEREKYLATIKVGDKVTRNMCGMPMELTVTQVTERRIHCGPWVFSKITGAEVDEELEWDSVCSGSYLEIPQ